MLLASVTKYTIVRYFEPLAIDLYGYTVLCTIAINIPCTPLELQYHIIILFRKKLPTFRVALNWLGLV